LNAGAHRLRLLVEDFDEIARAPEPSDACACVRCRTDPALRLCRADAFEDGRRAGLAERDDAAAAEAIRAAALADAIAAALRAADAEIGQLAEITAEALGVAVIAMVRAALPGACARLGAEEAGRLAAAVLPALARHPALTVEAPDEAASALAIALAVLPAALRGRTEIVPGETLRIAWSGGQVRRDAAAALAAIDDVLGQLGLNASTHNGPARQEAHIDG
jgi:hypothetical protein